MSVDRTGTSGVAARKDSVEMMFEAKAETLWYRVCFVRKAS